MTTADGDHEAAAASVPGDEPPGIRSSEYSVIASTSEAAAQRWLRRNQLDVGEVEIDQETHHCQLPVQGGDRRLATPGGGDGAVGHDADGRVSQSSGDSRFTLGRGVEDVEPDESGRSY